MRFLGRFVIFNYGRRLHHSIPQQKQTHNEITTERIIALSATLFCAPTTLHTSRGIVRCVEIIIIAFRAITRSPRFFSIQSDIFFRININRFAFDFRLYSVLPHRSVLYSFACFCPCTSTYRRLIPKRATIRYDSDWRIFAKIKSLHFSYVLDCFTICYVDSNNKRVR